MKLITRNGELDLPRDFSITMKRTNPLLSDEGDASIPATLPSSTTNLAIIGHRERIDRANRYTNKEEAILQVGPVQKRGQIVMDSVHRREGIDASFAIDSSDLYAKAKEKSLKTLFRNKDTEGVSKVTWPTLQAAIAEMQGIYSQGTNTQDYTIFPVRTAPYEDTVNEQTVRRYQYNNEVDASGNLVYAARTVREGEVHMHVPEGYGIAPFMKLHRMIARLFECVGYTVVSNCFDDSGGSNVLANLVIVHNCADALVRPVLEYADLVPSCSLSDFLEWLLAKFHVQPVVDSETRAVKIVTMEQLLAETADIDISEKVEGDWTVQLNPSKRIVLKPTGSREEGEEEEETEDEDSLQAMTKPAARTLNGLMRKYGSYVAIDEDGWDSLAGQEPEVSDCLFMRKATGEFYILNRDLQTGTCEKKRLGTDHFVYDRYNSEEKETWEQGDVIPLMMVDESYKRGVSPYIGERIHFHTSGQGAEGDEKQEIIVCQRAYNAYFAFKTTGTTQSYIPYSGTQGGVTGVTLGIGLTNDEMYSRFWAGWNELLLNSTPHLTGRVYYSIGELLNMDMSRMKHCLGQRLLPVSATARLSDRMGLTEVEMVVVKSYADGVTDTPIEPSESNGLTWSAEDNIEEVARLLYTNEIAQPNGATQYTGYEYTLNESLMLGMPTYPNEVREVEVQATITVRYKEREIEQGQAHWINSFEEFANQTVTFTFTAVTT